jgi:2-C-methyl-D-erythritol 4-phosphate cytidylyltransferase
LSNIAIILSAGKGERIGSSTPKQYLKLNNKPVLEYSLDLFEGMNEIDGCILVVDKNWTRNKSQINLRQYQKIIKIIEGGQRRQDSVYNGVCAVPKNTDIIIIHDSARPFPPVDAIKKGIKEAKKIGGCILAVPVRDTIKEVNKNGRIIKTPKRENLFIAQTPQIFKYSVFNKLKETLKSEEELTDDAMLFERSGKPVSIVMGGYDNIKITDSQDILIAEKIQTTQIHAD